MGIAQFYERYVDYGMGFPIDDLDYFVAQGREEFVEERVASLVARWRLMNVYLAGGMPRPATAKRCRQVARNSCSWLMRVNGLPAYDWTYLDASGLMPEKSSEEYRVLAHRAASLDMSGWLHEWREDVLTRLTWFCTISQRCLDHSVRHRREFVSRLNKTANAMQREMDGCVKALEIDEATPKRAASAASEEE